MPSLAEQRGFSRDEEIISVHGGKGAFPFADVNTENDRDLLYLIAKTISFPMANKFLEPYAGAVLAKIAILVIIILFIQKRPRGLFALKGRAVEA